MSILDEWWTEHRNDEGVTAQMNPPRMLRATWSSELAEDLYHVYGIDIAKEFTKRDYFVEHKELFII